MLLCCSPTRLAFGILQAGKGCRTSILCITRVVGDERLEQEGRGEGASQQRWGSSGCSLEPRGGSNQQLGGFVGSNLEDVRTENRGLVGLLVRAKNTRSSCNPPFVNNEINIKQTDAWIEPCMRSHFDNETTTNSLANSFSAASNSKSTLVDQSLVKIFDLGSAKVTARPPASTSTTTAQ
jgi:hypothetical protein